MSETEFLTADELAVLLMSIAGAVLIYYGVHYSDGEFAQVLGALSIAWPQLELFLARRAA